MVDEFKVINVMNETMLKISKDKNESYKNNLKIRDLMQDEALFFKIDKEKAYKILQAVGVKQEQLENTYKKLINSDVFYDLVNKGKINANDKKLVVKYKIYQYDNLFKKSDK